MGESQVRRVEKEGQVREGGGGGGGGGGGEVHRAEGLQVLFCLHQII